GVQANVRRWRDLHHESVTVSGSAAAPKAGAWNLVHPGKVGRIGGARHIRTSEAINGDARIPDEGTAILITAAAQVAGVNQCVARSIDLGHEGVRIGAVAAASVAGLWHLVYPRKIGRIGASYYIGITRAIHRDACPLIVTAAAEQAGVNQGAAGSIDLANENIDGAATTAASPAGGRDLLYPPKNGRGGRPRQIGVAGSIHCDVGPVILTTAAEQAGVNQGAAGSIDLGHKGVLGGATATASLASARNLVYLGKVG